MWRSGMNQPRPRVRAHWLLVARRHRAGLGGAQEERGWLGARGLSRAAEMVRRGQGPWVSLEQIGGWACLLCRPWER